MSIEFHNSTPWPVCLLGEVSEITLGGTPSTDVADYWGGSIPWMASGEVNKRHIFEVDGRITEIGLASSNATLVDPPAVAIGLAGQGKTRGTAALVHIRVSTNQSIALIKSKSPSLHTNYLFHNLDHRYEELRSRSVGGGRAGLSREILQRVPVALPDPAEQSRIAAVLDTVDEAIAKTEAVIAKLKQVRAGLLHDLLTRGLDENGQLRDPIAYPEQFQDSPIGMIPRDWNFESLGARLQRNAGVIQTGPFGSQLHAHEYTTDGVPVVMPQDILEGGFDDANIARISINKADELRRHYLKLGDLIFARRGDLSRCSAVTEREVGWLCGTGCLLMRFEQGTLSSSWLSLAYRHDFGQRQITARAVGTTMVNLNTTLLAHLVFAFPIKEEQEDIVRRVADADTLVQTESANLAKLNLLKSALMADLLTGRVRVPASL